MKSRKPAVATVIALGLLLWSERQGGSNPGTPLQPGTTAQQVSTAAVVVSTEAPKLEFEETLFDFGRANQGDSVPHTYRFKNAGNAPLVIKSVRSSCGCTAAAASTGPFAPGQSGVIEVKYDTRGKVGFAQKDVEVFSNDPLGVHTLTLKGMVLADEHPKMAPGEVLFAGSCAQCHSIPAKGRFGKELYDSVCALCHDFPSEKGKKWIAANRKELSRRDPATLKQIILMGKPGTSMPGYGRDAKGPLTNEQVDSLVAYLVSLSRQ